MTNWSAPGYVVGPIFAASGGMSHLFNVSDPALPLLPLVMKVLPLERTPDMVARMEREAYALSKMSGCDLIVRIQATGRCSDGSPYIVMERLNGEDLREFLKRNGPLEASRAVDIAVRAALALYACHCEEVLHRDVKPGNLFLHKEAGMRQVVKLLDFGISHTGVGPAITAINAYSGTRRYMAPEQWRGQDTEMADQFSLAVVLFETLTGQLPWPVPRNDDGGQHERLLNAGKFKRLREVRADLPATLEAPIARALCRDPEQRFPSIYEFGQALLPLASEAARSFFGEYVPKGRQNRSVAGVVRLITPVAISVTEAPSVSIDRGGAATAKPALADSEYATVPSQAGKPTSAKRRSMMGLGLGLAAVGAAGWFLLGSAVDPGSGTPPPQPESRGASPPPRVGNVDGVARANIEQMGNHIGEVETGPGLLTTPPAQMPPAGRAEGAKVRELDETRAFRERARKPGHLSDPSAPAHRKKPEVPYSKPKGDRPGTAIPD